MAAKRLEMRDIKRLFELRFKARLSQRQVARALGCGKTTVVDYELRAKRRGLCNYDQISSLNESELLSRLGLGVLTSHKGSSLKDKPLPEWHTVNQELKSKKHVTLALLWSEYRETYPTGYSYSQFCEHYRRWQHKLSVTLRQDHLGGEKVFVDYAGSTVDIVDPITGEFRQAQIFVGVLGASSYTYCEATWTQQLPDWIMSHRRMFEFFGGVPQVTVPDNLKSGVTKSNRYEAKINRTYQDLAFHYGTCIIPARSGKAKDKAKAEAGVLVVSRWIIAALRHHTFYSLEELNSYISKLLLKINDRLLRYVNKSRRELFETLDLPALGQLCSEPYQYAEWRKARVNIDYHIEFEGHFYSAPYQLTKERVDVRVTATTVELFYKSKRVASHYRSHRKGQATTSDSHRPASHKAHLEWTPSRIINWSKSKGGATGTFIEQLLSSKPHPEQGYRSALGVIRLADKYGPERLNKACEKALSLGSINYQTVKNMLKNCMEAITKGRDLNQNKGSTSNNNVRGREYYH